MSSDVISCRYETSTDAGSVAATLIDRLRVPRLYPPDLAPQMVVPDTAGPSQGQSVGGATAVRDPEGRRLVAACLAGDAMARTRFQERFGPLIYRFVRAAGGGASVEAGDFYVYLFEDDRLYRRLRSFEGRASLEPFLRGFVLPDLWKRFCATVRKESLETVSLDSDYRYEPAAPTVTGRDEKVDVRPGAALFRQLTPEKQLLVKLLYIEDFDLDAGDLQRLAARSGRSVLEVIELLERARESVRARERRRRQKLDEAESAAQWILQYERRAVQIDQQLVHAAPDSDYAARLRSEQTELVRKRDWRGQQRDRARAEGERATVTLRYRDIALLLNAPTGSVSAQIMRLRRELLARATDTKGGASSTTEESG